MAGKVSLSTFEFDRLNDAGKLVASGGPQALDGMVRVYMYLLQEATGKPAHEIDPTLSQSDLRDVKVSLFRQGLGGTLKQTLERSVSATEAPAVEQKLTTIQSDILRVISDFQLNDDPLSNLLKQELGQVPAEQVSSELQQAVETAPSDIESPLVYFRTLQIRSSASAALEKKSTVPAVRATPGTDVYDVLREKITEDIPVSNEGKLIATEAKRRVREIETWVKAIADFGKTNAFKSGRTLYLPTEITTAYSRYQEGAYGVLFEQVATVKGPAKITEQVKKIMLQAKSATDYLMKLTKPDGQKRLKDMRNMKSKLETTLRRVRETTIEQPNHSNGSPEAMKRASIDAFKINHTYLKRFIQEFSGYKNLLEVFGLSEAPLLEQRSFSDLISTMTVEVSANTEGKITTMTLIQLWEQTREELTQKVEENVQILLDEADRISVPEVDLAHLTFREEAQGSDLELELVAQLEEVDAFEPDFSEYEGLLLESVEFMSAGDQESTLDAFGQIKTELAAQKVRNAGAINDIMNSYQDWWNNSVRANWEWLVTDDSGKERVGNTVNVYGIEFWFDQQGELNFSHPQMRAVVEKTQDLNMNEVSLNPLYADLRKKHKDGNTALQDPERFALAVRNIHWLAENQDSVVLNTANQEEEVQRLFEYCIVRGISLAPPTSPTVIKNIAFCLYLHDPAKRIDTEEDSVAQWMLRQSEDEYFSIPLDWPLLSAINRENMELNTAKGVANALRNALFLYKNRNHYPLTDGGMKQFFLLTLGKDIQSIPFPLFSVPNLYRDLHEKRDDGLIKRTKGRAGHALQRGYTATYRKDEYEPFKLSEEQRQELRVKADTFGREVIEPNAKGADGRGVPLLSFENAMDALVRMVDETRGFYPARYRGVGVNLMRQHVMRNRAQASAARDEKSYEQQIEFTVTENMIIAQQILSQIQHGRETLRFAAIKKMIAAASQGEFVNVHKFREILSDDTEILTYLQGIFMDAFIQKIVEANLAGVEEDDDDDTRLRKILALLNDETLQPIFAEVYRTLEAYADACMDAPESVPAEAITA